MPVTLYIRQYFKEGVIDGLLHFGVSLIFGSTFQAFWYIMALVIGTAVVVGVSKYFSNRFLFILGAIIYTGCCLVSNYRELLPDSGVVMKLFILYPGVVYNSFPVSILWIVIGKYFAETRYSYTIKHAVFAFIVSLLLLIGEYIMIEILQCSTENDCYFMLVPVSVSLVVILMRAEIQCKYAKQLRKMSTIIYCFHASAASIIRLCLEHSGVMINGNLSSWLVFMIVAVVSVVLAIVILLLERTPLKRVLKYAH